MKIAKARLVSADRNLGYGLVAIPISFFVFAYSWRFGQAPILFYYALWFPLILVDYRHALGDYSRFLWIIAFCLFACLSVFWSAAPGVTMRAGLQYATHIVCALVAARTMSMRTLTLGAIAGTSLVLLYSMAFGSYLYDPLDGTFTFVGAFQSKNQLGFYASVGIFFAYAALFVLGERGIWRLLTLFCLAISGYSLFASQSATSVIATAATLSVMIGLRLILLFAPRARKGLLLFGIVAALAVAFVGLNAGGVDILLGAFGKDSTLTGRTYLWSQGIAAASENPVFGVGYYAYWVQGFPEAERLWQEFFMTARGGFHFHNTYIEAAVELGLVGMALISLVIIRVPAGHLMRLLDDHKDSAAYLAFGITAMLVVRSCFEVDVINPYHVGSFLLYYSAGLLAAPRRAHRAVRQMGRAGPQLREA